MFCDKYFNELEQRTPEQVQEDLKAFEESVRDMEKDFPELALARRIANQRWLIEQYENEHLTH